MDLNILVTKFPNHWDKVTKTKYPNHLVHASPSLLKADERALLIRTDATGAIARAWRGKIADIKPGKTETHFTVSTFQEVEPGDIQKYSGLKLGWHVLDGKGAPAETKTQDRYLPPFVSELRTVTNPFAFEDLVHLLIRLLGVHRSYRFAADEQAGKADGFFKFSSLAVIYDATLSSDFEQKKSQQILNYCNQLLGCTVDVPPNAHEIVAHHQKQVWIITRGRTRTLEYVADATSVIVKEVCVEDLIRLYVHRLRVDLSEEQLFNKLINLGAI